MAKLGRAALKSFGVKNRFVHMEFFRLTQAKEGLGAVGDFVGLEVNMRPAGGYTPDMMNYAHSTDVYQIWADMVCSDKRLLKDSGDHHYCVYAARRDKRRYVHSNQEIVERYGERLVMNERMPQVMAATMGNQMYMAKAKTQEDKDEFLKFVLEQAR